MDKVTVDQVKEVIAAADPAFRRWSLRTCSICDSPIGYVFEGGRVGYDSNCGCSRHDSGIQLLDPADLADAFNIQSSPEVRAKMWGEFTAAMDFANRKFRIDDTKLFARAREVAAISPHTMASGHGPSDVGDVLTRYLTNEMPFVEAMESLDGLALDYTRSREKVDA